MKHCTRLRLSSDWFQEEKTTNRLAQMFADSARAQELGSTRHILLATFVQLPNRLCRSRKHTVTDSTERTNAARETSLRRCHPDSTARSVVESLRRICYVEQFLREWGGEQVSWGRKELRTIALGPCTSATEGLPAMQELIRTRLHRLHGSHH